MDKDGHAVDIIGFRLCIAIPAVGGPCIGASCSGAGLGSHRQGDGLGGSAEGEIPAGECSIGLLVLKEDDLTECLPPNWNPMEPSYSLVNPDISPCR